MCNNRSLKKPPKALEALKSLHAANQDKLNKEKSEFEEQLNIATQRYQDAESANDTHLQDIEALNDLLSEAETQRIAHDSKVEALEAEHLRLEIEYLAEQDALNSVQKATQEAFEKKREP